MCEPAEQDVAGGPFGIDSFAATDHLRETVESCSTILQDSLNTL